MEKDWSAEIESLKSEIQRLSRRLEMHTENDSGHYEKDKAITDSKAAKAYELRDKCLARKQNGAVTVFGYQQGGADDYFWETEKMPTDILLQMDDEQIARVLSALASKQRIGILKAILIQPGSAGELTERLGMGTTGQFYHHLKVLQLADLVHQNGKGQYEFRGHRVPAFIMLLWGVWDALDTRYTSGVWEKDTDGQ